MKKLALISLIAASTAFGAQAATKADLTDANKEAITKILSEEGYEVGKFKIEDGLYEVYAKKDGEKFEVFLNDDFEIVDVKED